MALLQPSQDYGWLLCSAETLLFCRVSGGRWPDKRMPRRDRTRDRLSSPIAGVRALCYEPVVIEGKPLGLRASIG